MEIWQGLLLVVLGLVAGVINTMAGGGSNLTVPALMMMGMPADVANASNRVGVFLQCLNGSWGFHRHQKLPKQDLLPILVPTLLGGLIGAGLAALLPAAILKPALLLTMVGLALLMLIRPETITVADDEVAGTVGGNRAAWLGLLGAGIYGGFVQAGVGFLLITTLVGTLRYDLVRANALKLICSLGFTTVALVIFIANDLILWGPALVLASGFLIGSQLAVKIAINASQLFLRRFLFIMTLFACAGALLS